MARDDDLILIQRFLDGDAEATAVLDEWIAKAASAYQQRLAAMWEDVLQDIRLKIFCLLNDGEFRGESSLRTYLWRVVNRTCIDQIRSLKRRQRESVDPGDESSLPSHPSHAGAQEARDLLKHVWERISAECCELWKLVVAGWSYREMSRRLGIKEGALRVRVLRCRKHAIKIRDELKPVKPGV